MYLQHTQRRASQRQKRDYDNVNLTAFRHARSLLFLLFPLFLMLIAWPSRLPVDQTRLELRLYHSRPDLVIVRMRPLGNDTNTPTLPIQRIRRTFRLLLKLVLISLPNTVNRIPNTSKRLAPTPPN